MQISNSSGTFSFKGTQTREGTVNEILHADSNSLPRFMMESIERRIKDAQQKLMGKAGEKITVGVERVDPKQGGYTFSLSVSEIIQGLLLLLLLFMRASVTVHVRVFVCAFAFACNYQSDASLPCLNESKRHYDCVDDHCCRSARCARIACGELRCKTHNDGRRHDGWERFLGQCPSEEAQSKGRIPC